LWGTRVRRCLSETLSAFAVSSSGPHAAASFCTGAQQIFATALRQHNHRRCAPRRHHHTPDVRATHTNQPLTLAHAMRAHTTLTLLDPTPLSLPPPPFQPLLLCASASKRERESTHKWLLNNNRATVEGKAKRTTTAAPIKSLCVDVGWCQTSRPPRRGASEPCHHQPDGPPPARTPAAAKRRERDRQRDRERRAASSLASPLPGAAAASLTPRWSVTR
jgi:hypothetical protein